MTLDNYDGDGNRLVRSQETNSGDFAADALYYLFDDMGLDVDIAVMNGGGVRNQAITGDISYKTCKNMHPFGNVACLQTVTGQQILDMLEWGARHAGVSEDGSFLHVSGITYKINTSIADTTKADDMDIWVGGPDEYRVYDVMVYNKDTGLWEALDLNAEYNLAGYNYTLRDLGDGFAMLEGAVNVQDYVMEDYMVLANYIQGFEDGIVGADNSPLLAKYPGLLIDYSDVNGCGRIEVVTESGEKPAPEASRIYVGGIRATEDNAHDVLGDADGEAATVTYDAKTNTITLKDTTITTGIEYAPECMADIVSVGDLNIVLEGQNSVTVPDGNCRSVGIYVWGDLTVSGNGALNVRSGNITGDADDSDFFESTGIVVSGLLTIREAEVIAVGGDVTVTEGIADHDESRETQAYSQGVLSINGLTLDDGATLTAIGGNTSVTTVTTDCAFSIGLMVYYEDLSVYDATLSTIGGKAVSNMDVSSYGTVVSYADTCIYDSAAKVTMTSGTAEAPDITAANGICVYMGDLVIKAGDVTIIGGERTDVEGDAHAVYVEGATDENDVTIGGNMYVECDEVALGSDYGFVGTTVNLIAPDGDAIYASHGITADDILTVSEPVGGEIRQIGEDVSDVRYTVVNENGDAAQNVTIEPMTYKVSIHGLNSGMDVTVPVGWSVNETYCEKYGISDFSETLDTEKEGYIFRGFYTNEACTDGNEYTFDTPVTADVTIYPKWTEKMLYVNGIKVTEDNADDVLGDADGDTATVTYDAQTKTLTLNGYSYEGEGYQYDFYEDEETGEKEIYSAAIYSEDSITVKLVGTNTIKNSFNGSDDGMFGDGVISEGSITITGDGRLSISGSYCIDANEDVIIDGSTVYIEATDDGIGTWNGDAIIKNGAEVTISATYYGIYAGEDVTITDSTVDIDSETYGICSHGGGVTIESTQVSVSENDPWLTGTKVSINVDEKSGIFAYKGMTVDEKLTISVPEGAQIGEVFVEEYDYSYETVLVGETVAKEIVIEPLGYTVTIKGLAYDTTPIVPAGQSVNEAYCDVYNVEDFSEILDTEKEGYIFGGWYTDETCTAGNEFDFDNPVDADITIYAKWIAVHTVTVEKSEGGHVTVDCESAVQGENVVITIKPDDGKETDTVVVTDENGNSVTVTKNSDGTYSFTQPEGDVTVKVTYKDKQTVDGNTETDDNKPADTGSSQNGDNKPADTGSSQTDDNKSDDTGSPQTGDNAVLCILFMIVAASTQLLLGYKSRKEQ